MKKYLILVILFCLYGCESTKEIKTQKISSKNIPVLNEQANFKIVETVGLGEKCGGTQGIMCKTNLTCKMTVQNSDSSGTCIESVTEKELSCSKTQDPVCGLKDNNKNGYLNECEAIRHGAEILNKGFCKFDQTVKGDCEKTFTAIGNCSNELSGFVFNSEKNTCTKKFAKGCEAETPFESLKECQEKCSK